MAIKKLLPDDPVNICCGTSIYGGTYIGLKAYRISGGKPKFDGVMYHDKTISYRDLAKAFSEQELKLILKIKQGKAEEKLQRERERAANARKKAAEKKEDEERATYERLKAKFENQ